MLGWKRYICFSQGLYLVQKKCPCYSTQSRVGILDCPWVQQFLLCLPRIRSRWHCAKKMPLFRVILLCIFLHSDSIQRDTLFECKVMQTRIILNPDTSHAVLFLSFNQEKVSFISVYLPPIRKKKAQQKNRAYLNLVYSICHRFDTYRLIKPLTSTFWHYF